MAIRTVVEILDKELGLITQVKNLYPIDESGMVLRYSKELSDYGYCTFRVSTKDPIWSQFGDIVRPHTNHIRIVRGGEVVWQGAVVDNPDRNKNYIEVLAAQYLFYFDRVLIRRDQDKPETDEDESNFRLFDSGGLDTAVETIFDEAVADMGSTHMLATASVGDVENPDFPDGLSDLDGNPLTGNWEFSESLPIQFDYHSALYVLKSFGIYSGCDFRLNDDLTFDFKKQLGRTVNELTFSYNRVGSNIVDYSVPRYGKRMTNALVGIAADNDGVVLHDDTGGRNSQSIQQYGLLQEAIAFTDVKSRNALALRLNEQSKLVSDPEESPINLVLDEKAYPGQYDVGDIVVVDIHDSIISYHNQRRIVGITVRLHNTGREMTSVQTNVNPGDVTA